jgi:hypothetical protein
VYAVEVFMDTPPAPASTPPTTKPKPPTTTKPNPPTSVPQPTGNEIRFPNAYTTSYNWWDNNPPKSDAICCKAIHTRASGTGTFADPITVAVDDKPAGTLEFPAGTRFYVPNVRAYFVVEGRTGTLWSQNANSHGGATPHFDLWSDGRTSSESSAYSCMAQLTGTGMLVIQNPLPDYAVVAGPLAANGVCRSRYGNGLVTNGSGPVVTTTTVKQPPVTATTVKPTPTTVKRPTVTTTTVKRPEEPRRWRSRWWRDSHRRGNRHW